jgi:acetyltransferase
MGGVYIEILKDVASALCPTTPQEVMKKLERLKSFALLKGYRGQDPYDIDAFVDCVVRVSHLMSRFTRIEELDVNPVRVFSGDKGLLALDARMRIRKSSAA